MQEAPGGSRLPLRLERIAALRQQLLDNPPPTLTHEQVSLLRQLMPDYVHDLRRSWKNRLASRPTALRDAGT